MSTNSMDWDAIRAASDEAVAAMLSMSYEPISGFKTLWPQMWCEWASIAIAEVLDARGLGSWTFVQHSANEGPGGHAWLELRGPSERRIYTIDATLQQFPKYGEAPFYGHEQTPAALDFGRVNFEGPWRDWPITAYKPQYAVFAAETLREMGLS